MKNINEILEFNQILKKLSELAISEIAKEKLLNLEMILDEKLCEMKIQETTEARRIIDSLGIPPISSMQFMNTLIERIQVGTMLEPEELMMVVSFIKGCHNMQRYLKRGEYLECDLISYGRSFADLEVLRELIEISIRNNEVDSEASTALKNIRRNIESKKESIKMRLEKVMQSKRAYLADSYILQRSGHYVLAVKREYKHQVQGNVLDESRTGSTVFIEPSSIGKLQEELSLLEIEEDNEVRKILYSLTNEVENFIPEIKVNMEVMEVLDIAFAKGKLSVEMNGKGVPITMNGKIIIKNGRHPLLNTEQCVPLNFEMGEGIRGVIITGPNTGGKTVTLKTVGLLTMMAQCGLHIPAEEGSHLIMRNQILCDIGDGQSITQNLSTFSAHIVSVIEILKQTTAHSLVLLDELGSGTDPAEGMGIAIATLEALRNKNCLIVATTHYPEVKEYAQTAEGFINARMKFDKESLRPLYQLEIGEAGESCAFYIAEKLGFPKQLIDLASIYTYGTKVKSQENKANQMKEVKSNENMSEAIEKVQELVSQNDLQAPKLKAKPLKDPKVKAQELKQKFQVGDSVMVYPEKLKGLVFHTVDDQGKVGVQIQKSKRWVNVKRVKLLVAAKELYPEDYDFSIVFDSVANRKAKHKMNKGYRGKRPEITASYENMEEAKWQEEICEKTRGAE